MMGQIGNKATESQEISEHGEVTENKVFSSTKFLKGMRICCMVAMCTEK